VMENDAALSSTRSFSRSR